MSVNSQSLSSSCSGTLSAEQWFLQTCQLNYTIIHGTSIDTCQKQAIRINSGLCGTLETADYLDHWKRWTIWITGNSGLSANCKADQSINVLFDVCSQQGDIRPVERGVLKQNTQQTLLICLTCLTPSCLWRGTGGDCDS